MIDPDILKTATFLIVDDKPCSTVFFVRYCLAGGQYAYYAITTRHSIRSEFADIRFNLWKGGKQDERYLRSDWYVDSPTDIAVLPLNISSDSYDIRFIDAWDFAQDKNYLRFVAVAPLLEGRIFSPRYGTGDQIYTLGLFEGHSGQHLAQPVVRFGHIALKPADGEKVLAEIDPDVLTPIDAFLVEMATWRGQSGSPVFLRTVPTLGDHDLHKPSNYLIGMIQGFYPGYQNVRIDGQDATLSALQMGIGLVIPAKDINEALAQESLKEQREKLERDKQQNPEIRPSAASLNPPGKKK